MLPPHPNLPQAPQIVHEVDGSRISDVVHDDLAATSILAPREQVHHVHIDPERGEQLTAEKETVGGLAVGVRLGGVDFVFWELPVEAERLDALPSVFADDGEEGLQVVEIVQGEMIHLVGDQGSL